jgi:hypothetical protein
VHSPYDLATLVHELVQQQSAFGQQQAALLQLQTETIRLQRLLIERALGASGSDTAVAPLDGSSIRAVLEPQIPAPKVVRPDVHAAELSAMADLSTAPAETEPPVQTPAEAETHHPPEEEHEESPLGNPPRLYLVSSPPTSEDAPAPAIAAAPPPPSTLRAARYLQPASAKTSRAVTWQDVERLSRLHEAGEAAHLVLHFGEHKGNTLLQVARNDPDYVRRLALNAQRPKVRAAARQLVVAIEASEQAAQRGRMKTRKVRADGR